MTKDEDVDTRPGRIDPGTIAVGLNDVPSTWIDAERSAPHGGRVNGPRRRRRRSRVPAIPMRHEGPLLTNLAALSVGLVAGSIWYATAVLDVYRGPWIAVGAGALIGLVVRQASRANPPHRALVAAVAYLLVLLVVTMLLTHHDLIVLYGDGGTYSSYERSVVRHRLQDPLHLTTYGLGGLLAAIVPTIGNRT